MRYEDASLSGSFQDQGPTARDDADQLAAGDRGPATGNVITGAGTETGAAGADAAAGAKITAVAGAGGSDESFATGRLQVAGEHGTLSINARGDYSYTAKANTPENSRDTFTYTLADASGATSQARLTIEIGKTQAVVKADAQRIIPGPDGVVVLPAGVELSDIRIVGRDLLVMLPDGSQMLIVDGAVFVPQLVINDVEVPSTNLAALLIDQEPRPASGVPQSSGGNFIEPVRPLDPGNPLGDLLPPTDLGYRPPDFQEVFQPVDRNPEVGENPLIQLDDDTLQGGNPGGTGDDPDSINASGILSGSGGDGPLTFALSTAGAPAGFSYVSGPNGSILVQQNGVTVLTVTVNAQTGAYTVTENAPILHAPGDAENNVVFTFSYTVTDQDGDQAAGTFQVNVDDDTPTIAINAGADAGVTLTTDDFDSRGEGTDSAQTSANFGGVFSLSQSAGADGLGTAGVISYSLGTPGGASGLTQGGVAINLYSIGGKVVASTATTLAGVSAANTVFDVSVSSTGVVTLTQYSQIDHTNTDPSATGAPFNDQLISLADNLVTLSATATITDKDGDSATSSQSIQIGANLRFTDDGPSLGEVSTGRGVVLDETSAGSPAGFPITVTSAGAVISGSALTFGADGPAASGSTSYSISIVGGGATPLKTAQGDYAITLVQTASNVITGTYNDGSGVKTAFTVTINANGTITVTENVPLEHNVDGSTPAAYDDALDLSGLINATVTIKDFDGDTASGSAPIGNLIVFRDDGPNSSLADTGKPTLILDETQPVGSDTSGAGAPGGLATVTANFAGNFAAVSYGADGAGSTVYSLVLNGTNVASGMYALQVGDVSDADGDGIGQGTQIVLNQVGNVITGSAGGVDYFTIAIDPATGIVTFTQLQPVWNPTPGASYDEAAILNAVDGALIVRQTVTDSDGDFDSSDVDVSKGIFQIQDDGPIARNDTDAIAAGTYGPETGNVLTGAGTTSGAAGADTQGRDGASISSVTGFGGSSDSTFDEGGNLVVNGQYGVLTLKADGSYSYVRNAGTPGGVSDVFTYTLRDTDGDTSTATLTIGIGNTPPTIDAPDLNAPGTVVYEAALPTRNGGEPEGSGEEAAAGANGDPRETTTGTINFTQGDGPAVITINGVTVTAVNQVIDTGEGLLTITSINAGSIGYSYTLKDNLLVSGVSTTDPIPVTITDQDGQTASDTLTITIVDDAPDARNDTDALAAGGYGPEAGNVISGAGTTSGVAGKDTVGADNATVVAVAGFNGSSDSTFDGAGNLIVNGQYGVLTIKADGSYSYVRNAGTPGGVSDVFTYTLRDGDGDQDTATLTISIGNTPPTINAPDLNADGTIVYEKGLPTRNGGEPEGSGEEAAAGANGDPSESTSGTITFTQGDGPAVITINGVTVTAVNQVIDTGEGLLTITSINAGSIGYSYTLKDNLLVAGTSTTDPIAVTITDVDGQTASDTLTITIVDDAPTARSDTDAVAAGTYGPELGNVISGVGTTSGAAGKDTVGADNATLVSVTGFGGSSDSTFDGAGNLVVNGQYGVLTIKADGSYSYVRNAGTPGGVTDTFNYQLQDGDGDTSNANLVISIGDSPVTLDIPPAGGATTTVFEKGLPIRGSEQPGSGEIADGNGTNNSDASEAVSGTIGFVSKDGVASISLGGVTLSGTYPQTIVNDAGQTLVVTGVSYNAATGVGSISYTYTLNDNTIGNQAVNGGDTNASFPLVVTDLDGDSSNGNLVIVIKDDAPTAFNDVDSIAGGSNLPATGNVITGVDKVGGDANATDGVKDVQGADGAVVVGIASNNVPANTDTSADGSNNYVVAGQYGTLTINADGSYSYVRADGSPGNVTDVFTYTIRDGDGDQATATLTINIGDAAPVTGPNAVVLLDDDALAGGIAGGTGDVSPDTANLTGTLAGSGGDGALTWSLALTGAPAGFSYVSNGAGGILIQQGGITYVTVTLNSSTGAYTVTQNLPLPHAAGGNENTQPFTLNYVVSDVDGDTAPGTLTINVNDDSPTATASLGVESNVLVTTFDANTIGAAQDAVSSTANFGGVFTLSAAAGADGSVAGPVVSYSLSLIGGTNVANLTQGGQPIYLYNIGGVIVGSTSSSNPGAATGPSVVFSIAVNNSGVVTLIQYSQIDHTNVDPTATGAPFNDQFIALANNLVQLTGSVTITDKDGDTATASQAVDLGGNIRFGDDGPVAQNDTVSQTTENQPVTFNVFGNDAFGADGVNINDASKVSFTQPAQGGTVSYNAATGLFTFTPAAGQEGTATFSYTITDRDGDTSTATVTITLQPDSIPIVSNPLAAVDDEGLPGGNPGGPGDLDANAGEVPLSASEATYNGKINVNFGNDTGTIGFSNLNGNVVTVGQEQVTLSWNAGTNTLTGTGPRGALFSVVVNPTTGDYTVTLLDNVLHAQGDNVETTISLDLFYRAADSDGDVNTNGKLTIFFNDDVPVFGSVTSPLNVPNSGTVSATGAFQINLGGDGAPANNDVIKTLTLNGVTVNGVAATNVVLTEGVENATTASYTISFTYQTGNGTTATETGTLVIDKSSGQYTVDFADPIQGFSISSTSQGTLFQGYEPNTSIPDGSQPTVSVTKVADNLYVQFTGVAEPSSGTGANNLYTKSSGLSGAGTDGQNNNWVAGELFGQAASWVSTSNTANGVAGDTIQGGEVLDFNLYSSNPFGTVSTPTTSVTSMFIKLDGVGASEDMIVILKLLDTSTGQYTTQAVIVQNADIIKSNATLAGTPYAGVTLDNNDGLVVIEANDYQQGNTNLVIVGAQIAGSDEGVVGTGINLNGAIGASGGSSGTQAFSTDVSDAPFKVSDIGFITQTTTQQSATLDFTATIQDADGDTAQTNFQVVIGGTAPIAPLTTASTTSTSSYSTMSTALVADQGHTNLKDGANNNLALLAGLVAGFAAPTAAAASTGVGTEMVSKIAALPSLEGMFGHGLGAEHMSATAQTTLSQLSVLGQDNDFALAGKMGSSGTQHFGAAEQHQAFLDLAQPANQGSPAFALDQGTELSAAIRDMAHPVLAGGGGGELHLPSADQLALLAGLQGGGAGPIQQSPVLGQVLADALSGGAASGPDLNQLIDAAIKLADPVQHQPGQESAVFAGGAGGGGGLAELATQLNHAVPSWDGGHFGASFPGLAAAMDAPALHPDAVQPVANG